MGPQCLEFSRSGVSCHGRVRNEWLVARVEDSQNSRQRNDGSSFGLFRNSPRGGSPLALNMVSWSNDISRDLVDDQTYPGVLRVKDVVWALEVPHCAAPLPGMRRGKRVFVEVRHIGTEGAKSAWVHQEHQEVEGRQLRDGSTA